MAPSPRSGSRRSCCLQCRPPGRGRGRHCSRHAPRRTRARPPCTPTCTSPPTSTQAGTRLPGRPVACMLWLALLVCSLPGGLPLAARGRTRARPTPRSTFDIVPKTLPKTLPRYGVVTGAVPIFLSILAPGRCLRVTPLYSSLRRRLHRHRRQQGRTLRPRHGAARRGAHRAHRCSRRSCSRRASPSMPSTPSRRSRARCPRAVVALGRRPHRPHAFARPACPKPTPRPLVRLPCVRRQQQRGGGEQGQWQQRGGGVRGSGGWRRECGAQRAGGMASGGAARASKGTAGVFGPATCGRRAIMNEHTWTPYGSYRARSPYMLATVEESGTIGTRPGACSRSPSGGRGCGGRLYYMMGRAYDGAGIWLNLRRRLQCECVRRHQGFVINVLAQRLLNVGHRARRAPSILGVCGER